MKKIVNLFIVGTFISCAIILSGCEQNIGPTVNTGDNSLHKTFETRPFTGNVVESFLSQVNDSISVYSGTGNMTHLGYCTVVDTAIHHYTQSGLTVDGIEWITAANGSLIHLTWFMDYYDPTTWVWEIVGGTGRFTGATGSGTYTAGYTGSGDLWISYTGTITY